MHFFSSFFSCAAQGKKQKVVVDRSQVALLREQGTAFTLLSRWTSGIGPCSRGGLRWEFIADDVYFFSSFCNCAAQGKKQKVVVDRSQVARCVSKEKRLRCLSCLTSGIGPCSRGGLRWWFIANDAYFFSSFCNCGAQGKKQKVVVDRSQVARCVSKELRLRCLRCWTSSIRSCSCGGSPGASVIADAQVYLNGS